MGEAFLTIPGLQIPFLNLSIQRDCGPNVFDLGGATGEPKHRQP
jgi:hypothetical protein